MIKMEPFNKLTAEDITKIDHWITTNVQTPTCSMEHLLRFWNSEKSHYLFDTFGNELILEKPFSYHINADELRRNLKEILHSRINSITACIWELNWDGKLDSETRNVMLDVVSNYEYYMDNKYTGYTFTFHSLDTKVEYKISSGEKQMKVLAKVLKALSLYETYYEQMRLDHSMALNQKIVEGTICISIHPLDYMTMSDNDCDWDSCMSWKNDGCYRMGTVEMMNSPMVVVAYLKSKDDMYLNSIQYKWNSKRWRELFIVNSDIIVNIKDYPYTNQNLTFVALNWLKDLMGKDNYISSPVQVDLGTNVIDGHFINFDPETNLMYNDFGCDRTCHMAYFSNEIWSKSESFDEESENNDLYTVNFCYSGAAECMTCGTAPVYDADTLTCDNCDNSTHCACCGERISSDYAYWVGDEVYCENCYYDNTAEDFFDGERYSITEMREIVVESACTPRFYCSSSYVLDFYPSDFDEYVTDISKIRTDVKWIIIPEECLTEKGRRQFFY